MPVEDGCIDGDDADKGNGVHMERRIHRVVVFRIAGSVVSSPTIRLWKREHTVVESGLDGDSLMPSPLKRAKQVL